jgi:hypothetical protein
MITIGALNFEYGNKVVARFSNIGKVNVDVFAPGVKFTQHQMTLSNICRRTSMASQMLQELLLYNSFLLSTLTASQVKHILMDSGVAIGESVVVESKDSRSFGFV